MGTIAEVIFHALEKSGYTVVLSGYGMLTECGYPGIRDGEESYDIEQKYGYASEELFSSSFFSTRKQKFYEFYRNEILAALDTPPGKAFYDMAKLEREGLVQSIITRRIFHLPSRAGCSNVIELHGNVYRNYCTHCGREYPMEYVRDSGKIPLCEDCKQVVRPDVKLFGEMVDNQVITRASNEIQKADTILVLGANLHTSLCREMLRYYEGGRIILISNERHFADEQADIYWNSRVDDALDEILKEMEKKRS